MDARGRSYSRPNRRTNGATNSVPSESPTGWTGTAPAEKLAVSPRRRRRNRSPASKLAASWLASPSLAQLADTVCERCDSVSSIPRPVCDCAAGHRDRRPAGTPSEVIVKVQPRVVDGFPAQARSRPRRRSRHSSQIKCPHRFDRCLGRGEGFDRGDGLMDRMPMRNSLPGGQTQSPETEQTLRRAHRAVKPSGRRGSSSQPPSPCEESDCPKNGNQKHPGPIGRRQGADFGLC